MNVAVHEQNENPEGDEIDTVPPTIIVKYNEDQDGEDTPVLDLNVKGYIQPLQNNKSIMQPSNIRQAPSIFQGAVFNNCTINFQMSNQ